MTVTPPSKIDVLIIDDDAGFCEMLSEMLRETGLSVIVENNGITGQKSALSNHPRLVVLDIMMPGANGIDVLDTLRQDEWGQKVPIFVLTGSTDPSALPDAIERGGHIEYLEKPDWTLEALVEKIGEKLSHEQQV